MHFVAFGTSHTMVRGKKKIEKVKGREKGNNVQFNKVEKCDSQKCHPLKYDYKN